jgi:SAM-dependent methyltransferase
VPRSVRTVEPELLDVLPAGDPRAVRSRRDLRRVNALMGDARTLAQVLREIAWPEVRLSASAVRAAFSIVELGAGDGTLLLNIAQRLQRQPSGRRPGAVRATLVDRQLLVTSASIAAFRELGWSVEPAAADVFDWLSHADVADVILSNLFLHHFGDNELRRLMIDIAQRTNTFIACEPRRAPLALAGASLLPVVGCSDVTVHDAKISVRAGFRDRELSDAWPDHARWRLTERRAGPFTHLFVARRL